MNELSKLLQENLNIEFISATLSNPKKKDDVQKVKVRPVLKKEVLYFQFESFRNNQAFHENVEEKKACEILLEYMGNMRQMQMETQRADYTGVNKVDMVVTLHACDTATDYALAKAVGWDAKVILSVPCCQHELNRQIKNEILEPILKYGLLKERMAALITDGLRAQYLEREGYEAQILEFIDMEHTPKNILIRAVKKRHAKEDNNIEASIKRCEAALRVSPTLGRLLDGFATESANSEKDHPEKEDKEGV